MVGQLDIEPYWTKNGMPSAIVSSIFILQCFLWLYEQIAKEKDEQMTLDSFITADTVFSCQSFFASPNKL